MLSRGGGNLGESGSVAWIFEPKGVITVTAGDIDDEELSLFAIDAGAEDIKVMDDSLETSNRTGRRYRKFSEEFKRDAVRLVVEEKYSFKAAAKAVGVCEQTLRVWHRKFAPLPEPCGEDATVEQLRSENQRLRRELRRAELEREILKKATAYFAKESQ